MTKNTYTNQHGFSLIETLIAVSILMIAITGPLALVQAGLFSSIHQRNQVTATYLAQEALEYVKNLRDSNSYSQYSGTTRGWLTGPDGVENSLLATCAVPNGCYVDPHGKLTGGNPYVQTAPSVPDKKLRQPPPPLPPTYTSTYTGVFSYSYNNSSDYVDSPYTRTVKIESVSPEEVRVSATVSWMDNALSRSYTVSTNLFNYEVGDPSSAGPGSTNPGINAFLTPFAKSYNFFPSCESITITCDVRGIDPSALGNYFCQLYDDHDIDSGYFSPIYDGKYIVDYGRRDSLTDPSNLPRWNIDLTDLGATTHTFTATINSTVSQDLPVVSVGTNSISVDSHYNEPCTAP
jgi:prepilin-type N-terminal cleavage/methylation domain-containing protein